MSEISEPLREAVETSLSDGWSENRLAAAIGVAGPVLSRWRRGLRGLNVETAERIAAFYGARLTTVRKRPKPNGAS